MTKCDAVMYIRTRRCYVVIVHTQLNKIDKRTTKISNVIFNFIKISTPKISIVHLSHLSFTVLFLRHFIGFYGKMTFIEIFCYL